MSCDVAHSVSVFFWQLFICRFSIYDFWLSAWQPQICLTFVNYIHLYLAILYSDMELRWKARNIDNKHTLYELDLKWDLFIGYSRHFSSRCVNRKSVVGWENLLKAVVMNEVYSNSPRLQAVTQIILFIATSWMKFIVISHASKQ